MNGKAISALIRAELGFVKTHLLSLVCGVAALAAIGVAAMGVTDKSVIDKMIKSQTETGAAGISGLRMNAKNQECIDQERKLAKAVDDDYKATVEAAKRINRREPLMRGVFPKAEQDATRYAFKSAYEKEFSRLADLMGAETLPTPEEIEDERRIIAETQAPALGDWCDVHRYSPPGAVTLRMGGANVEPKYDPEYRARVRKARRIRCYVEPATFQINPLVSNVGAPSPEQMWCAQVSLWIQQDVVQAINALNLEAARNIKDGKACVEHSSIKRLISLRILGYILPNGWTLPLSPRVSGVPEREQTSSFADGRSNEQFDVIRFELTAVIDSRESLNVADAITKANFNKLLAIEVEAVDRDIDEQQQGYFYGTAPVAQVRMEFEMYMARDAFDEMKPAGVVQALTGKKPGG